MIGMDFDENICALVEPIVVHDHGGNGLAKSLGRILGKIVNGKSLKRQFVESLNREKREIVETGIRVFHDSKSHEPFPPW